MNVGDKIKVIDQEIYGVIVHDFGNEVVIEDEDAETDDNTLCFKKSEVEEFKMNKATKLSNGITLIEQSKLDDMNNHIAELEQILIKNYGRLPYKVREHLKSYLWSK